MEEGRKVRLCPELKELFIYPLSFSLHTAAMRGELLRLLFPYFYSVQNEKERQVAIASCTQGLPPGNYDNLL